MSRSQQFKVESSPSSLFKSEPDDSPLATPSASKRAFNSLFNSVPSSIAPDPPDIFQRIGPGKRGGQYLLYEAINQSEWVKWWSETDYGLNNHKVAWDSPHGATSETWKHFHQIAHMDSGGPKVMCKRCDVILEHPYATKKHGTTHANTSVNYHDTSTIKRHLQTSACRRIASGRNQRGAMERFIQTKDNSQSLWQKEWEMALMRLFTIGGIPFELLECPSFCESFRKLISIAHSAPSPPPIPSAEKLRHMLYALLEKWQQEALRMLPEHANILVSLDEISEDGDAMISQLHQLYQLGCGDL